jgi:hypothetical protein
MFFYSMYFWELSIRAGNVPIVPPPHCSSCSWFIISHLRKKNTLRRRNRALGKKCQHAFLLALLNSFPWSESEAHLDIQSFRVSSPSSSSSLASLSHLHHIMDFATNKNSVSARESHDFFRKHVASHCSTHRTTLLVVKTAHSLAIVHHVCQVLSGCWSKSDATPKRGLRIIRSAPLN